MWWFDSTCGCSSSDQDSHRFFPNVLGDTKKIPGERQRLVVLRRTVNPFPRGKHWRFNSSFAHLGRLQPIHREFTGRERLLCGELQEPGYDFLWLKGTLLPVKKVKTTPVRLVKRSRYHLFTVGTGVRFSHRTFQLRITLTVYSWFSIPAEKYWRKPW